MSHTDPIADMLTRIRNASRAKHRRVDIPASGMKRELARRFGRERLNEGYKFIEDRKQGVLRVYLKYAAGEKPVITGIRRISMPGLRRYEPSTKMPRVMDGIGIAIVSTSQGVMTGKECRAKGIGGEILCTVW
jgi:small subunit ribosomal protein S8